MNNKILYTLLILMWVSLIASIIVQYFSMVAYWVLLGVWDILCVSILITSIIDLIKIRNRQKKLNKD